MSTTKHTPGPWRYYTESQPDGCPIVGSGGPMVAMLAHSVNHPDQSDEANANAYLIAAAPELLEALECLLAAVEQHDTPLTDPERIAARSAIAKAKGES